MGDLYVKVCFLTSVPKPSNLALLPLLHFKLIGQDWEKCGFYLKILTDLSHNLHLMNCVSVIYSPSLHMRL